MANFIFGDVESSLEVPGRLQFWGRAGEDLLKVFAYAGDLSLIRLEPTLFAREVYGSFGVFGAEGVHTFGKGM